MEEPKLTTEKTAELLEHMKDGDVLHRRKDWRTGKPEWTFKRYHGGHWVDVTSEVVDRALKAAQIK